MDHSSPTYQHYRFGFMFYVSLIALFFACLIIVMGINRLFFDTIVNEQDLPLSTSECLSLAIPTLIFGSTWLWSFGIMIYQMIMHKHPLSSSKEGLHHVLIGGIFLAFIIILPIKLIPIDHIYLDTNNLIPQLRIKKGFITIILGSFV